jgi:hypothetical protein
MKYFLSLSLKDEQVAKDKRVISKRSHSSGNLGRNYFLVFSLGQDEMLSTSVIDN